MPKMTSDQIIKQGHKRLFLQWGGPKPNNVLTYAGQDGQNARMTGVTHPVRGGVTPLRVPDPSRQGKYKIVGRSEAAPDFDTATLTLLERHGSIPRLLGREQCPVNVYEPTGTCKDLSDFLAGWSDYVTIYSQGLITSVNMGDRTGWDTDNQTEDQASLVLADSYAIGSMGFGEGAATQIDREAVDVVYFSTERCGDCGPANDGAEWIYAITKSSGASPGTVSEVIYSTDGGATWTTTTATGIGATADAGAIDFVGDRLVVVVPLENAYYYATINNNTGVPGTWTKVTTGFVATKYPRDILVLSPREVYMVGDGGYIYKSTDITSGVTVLNAGVATAQNLKRIHGTDEVIVAVGMAGAIVYSTNRGSTWSASTTTPSGSGMFSVWVKDLLHWWVGTDTGELYYTINGGETWTAKGYTGSGVGAVRDIVFATDEVGWFCTSSSTPTAAMWATWNGGTDWTNTTPRIANFPTFDYINRFAAPVVSDLQVAANHLAVVGLAGDGSDGILLVGSADVL